jgi:hypothetical protein
MFALAAFGLYLAKDPISYKENTELNSFAHNIKILSDLSV